MTLRILITSHSHEFSQKILAALKANIQRPEFVDLYGNWAAEASKWAEEAITIERPALGKGADKDPTIDTSGVNKDITGGHYDIIIADDLHDDKNSQTLALREKVQSYLQTLFPVLEPGGVLLVIGTRWHAGDAYGYLIKKEEDRKESLGEKYTKQWDIIVHSSHLTDGSLYFPARLTEAFLEHQKSHLKPRFYAVWYENQPISDDARIFPPSWWHFYEGQFEPDPVPTLYLPDHIRVPVYVTMSIDPAMSRGKYADYLAVTVVGTSSQNNWYVMEAARMRGGPVVALPYITYCLRTYQPEILSIETLGFQEMIKIWLMERLRQINLSVRIKEYKEASRHKKSFRIEGLQPLFQQGRVFLKRGLTDLYNELREYPEPDHDDLLDSLAQHMTTSQPSRFTGLPGETLPPWRPPNQDRDKTRPGTHIGMGQANSV